MTDQSPHVDICEVLDDVELFAYDSDAPQAGRQIGQARIYLRKLIKTVNSYNETVSEFNGSTSSQYVDYAKASLIREVQRLVSLLQPAPEQTEVSQ